MMNPTPASPAWRPLRLALLVLGVLLIGAGASLPPAGALVAQEVAPADAEPAPAAEEPRPVTWGIAPASATGRDTRPVIDLVVEPGETVIERVVVDNYGEDPISLDLYAADARPAGGDFDVNASDEESTGVGSWVELGATELRIDGRGEAFVDVTIRVPDDATPGDHAGGVLASRRSAGVGDEVGIETERRVGTRLYLRVAGPIRPELAIGDLDGAYEQGGNPVGRGQVQLTFEVRNSGNVRLSGATSITIAGPFGFGRRTVRGPEVEDLLPGHGIPLVATIDGVVPLGRLDVDVEVEPTASIDQPLGSSVPSNRRSVQLTAVPVAALVVLGVLAASIVVRSLVRRRRKRAAAGAGPAQVPAASASDDPSTLEPPGIRRSGSCPFVLGGAG